MPHDEPESTDLSSSDLPILRPFNEEDEEDIDEAPRTVLITGAAGNIGRKLREAWADRYEIIPMDSRFDPDDPELIVADLAEWDESWTAHFDEADAVVHLAGNPDDQPPGSSFTGRTSILSPTSCLPPRPPGSSGSSSQARTMRWVRTRASTRMTLSRPT